MVRGGFLYRKMAIFAIVFIVASLMLMPVGVHTAAASSVDTTANDSPPQINPSGTGVNTTVAWHTNVTDQDTEPVVEYNNGMVFASAGQTVVKIDPATGERLNNRTFSTNVSIETVSVNTVYIENDDYDVSQQREIHAVDTSTFSTRWTTTVTDSLATDIVASSDYLHYVYTGQNNDTVLAIDADTGTVAWERTFTDTTSTAELPFLRYGSNLVYQGDAGIKALDSSSGSTLWSSENLFSPYHRVVDGTVVGVTNSPPTKSGSGPFSVGYETADGSVAFEQSFSAEFDPSEGSTALYVTRNGVYFLSANVNPDSTQFIGFDSSDGGQIANINYNQFTVARGWSPTSSYMILSGSDGYPILNTSSNTKAGSMSFDDSTAKLGIIMDIDGQTLYAGTTNGSVAAIKISPDTSSQSISEAIAGSDGTIGLSDIQQAIRYWANDEAVPNTGGKKIGLTKIQGLIQTWANGG